MPEGEGLESTKHSENLSYFPAKITLFKFQLRRIMKLFLSIVPEERKIPSFRQGWWSPSLGHCAGSWLGA